jgi:hypothetical protein
MVRTSADCCWTARAYSQRLTLLSDGQRCGSDTVRFSVEENHHPQIIEMWLSVLDATGLSVASQYITQSRSCTPSPTRSVATQTITPTPVPG